MKEAMKLSFLLATPDLYKIEMRLTMVTDTLSIVINALHLFERELLYHFPQHESTIEMWLMSSAEAPF